jgi:hypothetical protein
MRLTWKIFFLIAIASAPLAASAQEARLTDGSSTLAATTTQPDIYGQQTTASTSAAGASATSDGDGFFMRLFTWIGTLF